MARDFRGMTGDRTVVPQDGVGSRDHAVIFSRLCVGVIDSYSQGCDFIARCKLQTGQHQVAHAYCDSVDFRKSLFSSSVPSMSPSTSRMLRFHGHGDQSLGFLWHSCVFLVGES